MTEGKKLKFKCLGNCEREFTFGDWECFPGQPHEVEAKTYYLADAPFMSKHDKEKDPDGLMLRNSQTFLHCIPERTYKDETGQLARQAFQPLVFKRGRLETTNPMEQYYLERSEFPVSYEKWFEAYHTPSQKQNIKDNTLVTRERDLERKERELNDLLAQAKANIKGGKPASA